MAIKKVIEIDVDVLNAQGGIDGLTNSFKEASKDTESLRTQMRKAQQEVAELSAKFGATSKEATEAAKKAAILKDRIGDAKSLTDAFNPDAKFKSLSASLSGVAGGFAAVQGAMGLLGTENKDLEQQLLKVQSAMAIAAGAQQVGESIDAFKQLGAVVKSYSIVQKAITVGQYLWNAAMAANPIGAIIAVVTALVAAGYALVNMFIASSEATKKAEKANKELNKELETQIKTQKKANEESDIARDYQLKMAKASGKSAEEIRKLSVELANQEVSQKMANAQTLRAIAIEAMRVAGLEDATDAEKETAKNALKAFNDANNDLKVAVTNRRKLLLDNRVAETQEQTDAREKKKEADKKAGEEANKTAKELAAQKRKDELAKINEDSKQITEALEDREKKKAEIIKQADQIIKELEQSKETPAQKLEREYKEELAILTEAKKSTLKLTAQYNSDVFALQKEDNDKKIAELEFYAQKEKDIDEATKQAKRDALETGLNILMQFAGKNKSIALGILAIQKGLAIADIVVGASKSIANAQAALAATPAVIGVVPNPMYKVQAVATVKGIALTKITAATSIASILAASIGQAKSITGGGGEASAGGGGGGAGGGGAQAPSFNVVGNSGVNQIAQTLNREQAPIQAVVVANNVTTAQSANRNIVQNASLG